MKIYLCVGQVACEERRIEPGHFIRLDLCSAPPPPLWQFGVDVTESENKINYILDDGVLLCTCDLSLNSFRGFHVGDAVKLFLTHTSTFLTASKNGLGRFLTPTNWVSG